MKKVLIADDEDHICEELKYIIKKEAEVKIVKICLNGIDAIEQISKLRPDIVFLDIEMPGMNGIQLGYYLRNLNPQPYVIYVTAYDRFAVEAFRVGARGYILKPFSDTEVVEQLQQACNYLDKQKQVRTQNDNVARTKLAVDSNGKFKLLEHNDIIHAFANDRAVYVCTKDNKWMVKYSLSELEHLLPAGMFIRCHRNYLVNVSKVKEVIPWFNSTYMLVMEDDTNVPVSRANIKLLKEHFCL